MWRWLTKWLIMKETHRMKCTYLGHTDSLLPPPLQRSCPQLCPAWLAYPCCWPGPAPQQGLALDLGVLPPSSASLPFSCLLKYEGYDTDKLFNTLPWHILYWLTSLNDVLVLHFNLLPRSFSGRVATTWGLKALIIIWQCYEYTIPHIIIVGND